MKVLIIGANGQLGWELKRTIPGNIDLTALDYPQIDISDKISITNKIKLVKPDLIINAAAYTAVDKAETEFELADLINNKGAGWIAEEAEELKAELIHISTDFVFDGNKSQPYCPMDKTNPLSVYGQTKLEGEKAVLKISNKFTIVRTSWLYSSHGENFVKTMIGLMSSRDSLNVIEDQVGTPTWANGLARAVWQLAVKKIKGVFHWADAGVASWYDFAIAIQDEALLMGLIDKAIPINPIPASAYPVKAKRPSYSVLNNELLIKKVSITPIHWRNQLRNMLKEMKL